MVADSANKTALTMLRYEQRFNVAVSRAQTLAIVVGSPRLEYTRVSSVDQMRLVNLFCRFTSEASRPTRT